MQILVQRVVRGAQSNGKDPNDPLALRPVIDRKTQSFSDLMIENRSEERERERETERERERERESKRFLA